MTDRELLEAAAKAAGYDIDWSDWLDCGSHTKYKNRTTGQRWNAEHDDGDALRLAGACSLVIHLDGFNKEAVRVDMPNAIAAPVYEYSEGDKYAATRRAIVRAAAEIGRQA